MREEYNISGSKSIDVSVIIVNYDTLHITQACIDSVFEKTNNVAFEIILVDNASSDGSKDAFSKDDRIKYIYLDKNLGFGKANNVGLEYAIGEYILCLNSDTILLNNAIELFLNKIKQFPSSVACLGTILLDVNKKPTLSYGTFRSISKMLKSLFCGVNNTLYDSTTYGSTNDLFKVDYITGADLFINRHVIDTCGFFDEDFFLYFEETEMQYRFQRHGFDSYIFKEPQIIHLEGASNQIAKLSKIQRIKKQIRRKCMIRKSERLFYKKTKSPISTYLIYYPITIIEFIFQYITILLKG